jgi:hypothetical protein
MYNQEYFKNYYVINAKKLKDNVRLYREKNKENIKAYQDRYRITHAKEKKEYDRLYRLKTKGYQKEYYKTYRVLNADKLKEKARLYREKNKNHIKIYLKKYNSINKERLSRMKKIYALTHKDERNKYISELYNSNPKHKLIVTVRSRIRMALKDIAKWNKTQDMIGCDINFLKNYLEKQFVNGMTWKNYGRIWHIDHRIPCSFFDLNNITEQKKCFHYTNMTPKFVKLNLEKRNHYAEPSLIQICEI